MFFMLTKRKEAPAMRSELEIIDKLIELKKEYNNNCASIYLSDYIDVLEWVMGRRDDLE